jgi:putative ATP-dependent endonuclease of OLD family
MLIRGVQIRHFRSIETVCLEPCGDLNILIGKNSAGKSNILSAINLLFTHLKGGNIAGSWISPRLHSEFNNRVTATPVRIGIEVELSPEINESLRGQLTKEAPHLEKSIEQVRNHDSAVFTMSGVLERGAAFLFIDQIGVGKLLTRNGELSLEGIRLLSVTQPVAFELFRNVMSAQSLRRDLKLVEEFKSGGGPGPGLDYVLEQPKESRGYLWRYAERTGSEIYRQIDKLLASGNPDEVRSSIAQLSSSLREKIDTVEKRETEGTITAFAGDTRTPPAYAGWLMKQFGAMPILQIGEIKKPIGREEAETLLRLKVKRGGPERLLTLQRTVRNLLGVVVDAFEADARGERTAEMDVDDFLVEANGSGIREALRLILDVELKSPRLVLIEEPEVHLHPGLARVIAGYLREKSRELQLFVTTHSTDFVDIGSLQNIFLVGRDSQNQTSSESLSSETAISKIPAELGLKLSTVFMFDRLVFVEGPSDEAILRQLAEKLDIDLAKNNVGFVRMGGVRNFAHYAAEATLDILSRRKVIMTFIADRDERDDTEVAQMIGRLGERALLRVLLRRELENYLLDPTGVQSFIAEKLQLSRSDRPVPAADAVRATIEEEAISLKAEVIRLRLERRLLVPVFLHTRATAGTVEERIRTASAELTDRAGRIGAERTAITAEVDSQWPTNAVDQAPGSQILERVAARFGVKYSKDSGDSERLARLLPNNSISYELRTLFDSIVRA